MATHFSILAWKIPCTEEPGGYSPWRRKESDMTELRSLHLTHSKHSVNAVTILGLPRWLSGKESACQCRRHEFDPLVGRSPGEGNGNSLQYSCLGNSMDCSPPGSSVHGIFQARILKWVAILFSRGSSHPRDQTLVSCIAYRFFTIWATKESPDM